MADLGAGVISVLVFTALLALARQPLWLSGALAGATYLGIRLIVAPKPRLNLERLAQRWGQTDEGQRLSTILRLLQAQPNAPERAYVEQACAPFAPGEPPTGATRESLLALLETIERRLTLRLAGELHENDRARANELIALRQTLIELEASPTLIPLSSKGPRNEGRGERG